MKLVYLMFCDDMVLNDKTKKKKKTKKKTPKQNKQELTRTYNALSTDREVLIKVKHGC